MRSKLLITSAAALLAGTVFAMGQGAPERKDPGITQGQPGLVQPKGAQGAQKELPNRPSTTGQAPREEQPKGAQSEPKGAQEQPKRPATTGQAPREEPNRAQDQNQRDRDQNRTQGQEQNRNQGQMQRDQDRQQQGQRQGGGSSNTTVTLTTEQRTKIRETVLKGSNAPRVSNVTFTINVGTVVPRTVRVVEVPETIVEIHPEWRRFRYFVYNEEIIIVDPDTLTIVAVIDV